MAQSLELRILCNQELKIKIMERNLVHDPKEATSARDIIL
jgi:hypothetical protein